MHPQGIIDVELGRRQPTLLFCRRLAPVLGVSIAHLGAYDAMPESTLAERIKKARYYRGMTIKEAAKGLGVYWTTWRDWEHRRVPTEENMERLNLFLLILSDN